MLSVRRPALVLALATPLLLAGCGGNSTPKTSSAPGDASSPTSSKAATSKEATNLCPKITAADMSMILGYEVASKESGVNACSYDSVKADARTEPSVGLSTQVLVDGAGGFEGTKSGAASAASSTAIDLPGVGDQAFSVTSGDAAPGTTCQAIALLGNQVVTVILTGGGSANKAKLLPIGTTILKLAVSKV